MIKASGPETVLLGLSRENCLRLMEGKPIRFDGKDIGLNGKTVYIVYGETEETIMDDLRKAGLLKL